MMTSRLVINMRRYIAALIIGFVIGAYINSVFNERHLSNLKLEYNNAIQKQENEARKTALEYKNALAAANDKPAHIERVYIKANCVPAPNAGQLATGGNPARIELSESATASFRAVINEKEELYRACSYRLTALQQLFK